MITRYCDGAVPVGRGADCGRPRDRVRSSSAATDASWSAIGRVAIHDAIGAAWELVDALNGYLTIEEPWTLAKDPAKRERLETVLATAYHGLGTLAVLLSPVHARWPRRSSGPRSARPAPSSEQRIDRANEWTVGTQVAPLEALFPRIEVAE